ncbi:hypothetical protein EJB05_16062, partial [Eragrostis curvula]
MAPASRPSSSSHTLKVTATGMVTAPPARRCNRCTVRGTIQALGTDFSCAHLIKHLVSSYKLQYGCGWLVSTISPPIPWLHKTRMHVEQVQCAADGAMRSYVTFSNDTNMWGCVGRQLPRFTVKEAAIVAEGHWDSARGMICFRACRVVHSGNTSLEVQEQECSIRMNFWFPAVWTIRDRGVVAGTLWHSSQGSGKNASTGAISASSIDIYSHRSNFSSLTYKYTLVEEAKKHYFTEVAKKHYFRTVLSNQKNKVNFPAANYTYHDFEFRFLIMNKDSRSGHGDAYPVTINTVVVYGDPLGADDSLSQHAVVGMEHGLLTISYNIHMLHYVQPRARPKNDTYSFSVEERLITAEGVYDPETGFLCMIGCMELKGSTDCQILITVQFASLDAKAQGHGTGVISSLRAKTDGLFFEKMDISLYRMYAEQVSEAVSRMDMESIMLVVSTTLPCIFTLMQILHAKRNPEASAAMSITMLLVLALGYVAILVISSEALFSSRRKQYVLPFQRYLPYDLSQAMLRAPAVIAFVLQLRLLQLAWPGRRSAADRSNAETWSAAERKVLWICLPLYLLGGALTIILHVMYYGRAAPEDSLFVGVGPEPTTLWEDLVSSAGLALDGFLLPQVAMNAFSCGRVGSSVVRATPHVYDVIRARGYVPSMKPSNIYASYRDDRFGMAWDIIVPCGVALLALLLYLQQRLGGAFFLRSRRRLGE